MTHKDENEAAESSVRERRKMMTRQERAKIFVPFDAMKGLQEALREQKEEMTRTQRRGICDEAIEANSRVFSTLKRGLEVEIFCWSGFRDAVRYGKITYINLPCGYLELNHEAIELEDIYSISVCVREPRPWAS